MPPAKAGGGGGGGGGAGGGGPPANAALPPPVPPPPVAPKPVPQVGTLVERVLADVPYCYLLDKSNWAEFKRALNVESSRLDTHFGVSRKTVSRDFREKT